MHRREHKKEKRRGIVGGRQIKQDRK